MFGHMTLIDFLLSALMVLVVWGIPISIAVWFIRTVNAIAAVQRAMLEQLRVIAQQGQRGDAERLS